MSGLDLHGLFTVCETCDSEIDFPDGPGDDLAICRACGEAFLVDLTPAGTRSQSS